MGMSHMVRPRFVQGFHLGLDRRGDHLADVEGIDLPLLTDLEDGFHVGEALLVHVFLYELRERLFG